jgi:CheY-like chemotaxis protein
VLVVDDNETIRMMSQRMIEMLGHTVRTASDGEEAVAVAEEFRPEIVLMDLGMPNMDGCEAARQIRQKDWGQEITLVALSGWGQEKDRLKSEAAGFDHHLVKPAASADIKRVIAQTEQKVP